MNVQKISAVFLTLIVFFLSALVSSAETPRLIPDAPPLDRERNLVVNGSFEVPHLTGGSAFPNSFPSIDGDDYYYIIEASDIQPQAVPDGWTTHGGGPLTYARWGNNYFVDFATPPVSGQAFSDPNIHGERSIYMGNNYPSEISEVPTYLPTGEVVFTQPPVFKYRPGYDQAVYMSQTVKNLIPGRTYRLSFWCSGEWSVITFDQTLNDGFFAFDLEGYDRLYLVIPAGNVAAPPGKPHIFGSDPSHTFTVEFEALEREMDLTFINWGHMGNENANPCCNTIGWTEASTPEVIIDDVIINLVRSVPTLSEWGLFIMAALVGIAGLYVIRKRKQVST